MNNLNSILIEGNLVRDPEMRTASNGTPVCAFSIASSRYFKQDSSVEKEVSYFNVESWAKLAENVGNYGHKGRGVRVVGRLKQERWQDKEGNAKSKVVIVAEHIEFRPEFVSAGTKAEREDATADSAEAAGEALVPTF
jgi:single-strand DNA-binding protein